MDKASLETGVSKAMLGQIERGESSPTISILWKIATGFGVSFSYFVEDFMQPISPLIQRTGHLQQLHPQENQIRITPLFPYEKTLKFEVFIIELLPGYTHLSSPHQKGVIEHLLVTRGEVDVLVGDLWQNIKENEGLRFNADVSHGYRNNTGANAIFYCLVHYTHF